MSDEKGIFRQWCVVEVMGHSQYAGMVSDFALGGASFIRVDVPEIDGRPGFTKLLSPGSIFCITPCTKEAAYEAVKSFRTRPFATFDLVAARPPALPGFREAADDDASTWGNFADEEGPGASAP